MHAQTLRHVDEAPRASATAPDGDSQDLAILAATAASAKKGRDIRVLDLAQLLGITDYFVLVTAGSERQLDTIVDEIERRSREWGRKPERREGTVDSGWVLLDYGDIVVHAFDAAQRSFYALERLWADAPELELAEAITES